jgi:hypothetical protein
VHGSYVPSSGDSTIRSEFFHRKCSYVPHNLSGIVHLPRGAISQTERHVVRTREHAGRWGLKATYKWVDIQDSSTGAISSVVVVEDARIDFGSNHGQPFLGRARCLGIIGQ